ncbi:MULTISPECIES: A/G-specific adenine glycosylase [unclassified Capnocytophaga]|jgi:A/G-specific adenine glycosylase|uniref:A/G-specific adenine glycosylase n=1 Tax=unclassified Capnocytophaga TaxID=2640652 RepID=UPI000202FB97|nr:MULTISPECIES: A/G-specific adenine glycosylase [unclassified Capnocytophaga]EGD33697.1 A/G-specific adenine glycosylase [Capnocytophaga sp. oral taxon 338 str. F0234]MEB3004524.1 A/G-specific adenine glycosylase [Capnocytophaga sp. G2]
MGEDFADFSKILLQWYGIHKRDLPWRGVKNPYYVWLSEVILQQTRISQGLPYYLNFIKNFPTIQALAEASEEKIFKVWQGLGYYSRAKNLHLAAKYITDELQGVFPMTYDKLLLLKGVGDYTASAIASICFNEPKATVDGNVYRVLSRIFDIELPINSSEGIKYFKQLATCLLDKKRAGEYNQAIMDFGAIQCKPQSPNCSQCVMNGKCLAYKLQKVNQLPVKLPKTKITYRYFHYCILIDTQGQTSLEKRKEKDIWQGLYEFPLIELKENTIEDSLLIKRIKEKYPKAVQVEKYITTFVHKLTHQYIHAFFWKVTLEEKLTEGIPFSSIYEYPMPILIIKFLKTLDIFER